MFTIGHTTRGFDEFAALLSEWNIEVLADVRSVPRSRRNPQFNSDVLANCLAEVGIEYGRLPGLGGWRRPRADSPNTGWRLASFRGFADYMLTADFQSALGDLIARGCAGRRLAFMCAEVLPWRCHRALIADALVVRGYEVRHVMSAHKADAHRVTPFASVEGVVVTYPSVPA
jgi:uncharacterized protein (DUF488 family)